MEMRSKRRPKEEEDEEDSPRKRKKKMSIYERDNLGELPFDIEADDIWFPINTIWLFSSSFYHYIWNKEKS